MSNVVEWAIFALSCVKTACCLVYMLRKIKSKQLKENCVVLLCSVAECGNAFFYCYYDLYYQQHLKLGVGAICTVMPLVYKISIAINRCCCNLIFAYRYKTINKISSIFAAKRAYWFSIGIVLFSVAHTVVDCIYFTVINPKRVDCFSLNLEVSEKYGGYIYAVNGSYLVIAVFQTIILKEIIKPIYNHCTRLSNSTISKDSIRSSLYRIVLSTLVFSLSDFSALLFHVIRAVTLQTRSPMTFLINLSVNTLSLMCSYEDYKFRLFPFVACKATEDVSRTRKSGREMVGREARKEEDRVVEL